MSDPPDISTSDAFLRAKLEALAEFAAGAGHEINNPVATIVGRAELLLKGESNPERRQALLTIGAQALRIRDMIGDLMVFARPPRPEPQSLNLASVVDDVLLKLGETLRAKSLSVVRQGEDSVAIYADPVQLRVVISNLLLNSANASAAGGSIEVECSNSEADSRRWANGTRFVSGTALAAGNSPVIVDPESPVANAIPLKASPIGRWAVLALHDRGTGLSAIEREHLFDPFFSGRQAGRGLGFGLCKCWRIVELHGGRIDCESSAEKGTTFRVTWPADG